jgi:hypothetical protein
LLSYPVDFAEEVFLHLICCFFPKFEGVQVAFAKTARRTSVEHRTFLVFYAFVNDSFGLKVQIKVFGLAWLEESLLV